MALEFVEPIGPKLSIVGQPVIELLQRSRFNVVHPSLGNSFGSHDAALSEYAQVP
jgi:hypothetical protein